MQTDDKNKPDHITPSDEIFNLALAIIIFPFFYITDNWYPICKWIVVPLAVAIAAIVTIAPILLIINYLG